MRTISSSFPLLREAKVINTTDPEELGRIQLKIYPELAEIPDADCPWAFPATGGIHGKSFGVPLKNQLISCFCWSKYWNEFSFLPFNITKPTEHLFDDFMKNVRPLMKDVPTDPEEEHLIVERYEDDFSEFHDAKNRQHGWVHPSGAHATINDLGDIFLWLIKLLTVHNGDDTIILKVNPEDKSVKFYQTGKLESETDDSVNIKIHKTYDLKVDGNVTNKFNAEETTEVIGNSSHKSANTDIESTAPVGIKGTGTLLGAGVLQPYWADETAAWTQYPVIIPPVPWPPGMGMSRKLVTSRTPHAFAPVSLKRYANAALRKLSEQVFQTFRTAPPPIICMALNGIKAALLAADTDAMASGAKSIK